MSIVRIKAPWNLQFEFDHPKDIELLIEHVEKTPIPADTIRIVALHEPSFLLISDVMKYIDYYTYVLTFHQELIDNNYKARLFSGTTTWVDYTKTYPKKFAVSTIVGGKSDPRYVGYALRHKLFNAKDSINIKKEFYLSSAFRWPGADYANNLVLGDDKGVMFDCMFHIAIENVYLNNWFSEKLLDCLLTRTIPIYFGTPNIGQYFNNKGIISVRTVDEMVQACNGLTEDYYYSLVDVIEENYHRALEHANYNVTLRRTLNNLLA